MNYLKVTVQMPFEIKITAYIPKNFIPSFVEKPRRNEDYVCVFRLD